MGIFKKKASDLSLSTEKSRSVSSKISCGRTGYASTKPPTSKKIPSSGERSTMLSLDITIPPAPDPAQNPAAYLRSIYAVRERSMLVYKKAHANQLNHFDVDLDKFKDTADYVIAIIKRDFAGDYKSIPPHGRWQHFEAGGEPRVSQLLQSWPGTVDAQERTRRLIDLFLVSVLLDAGAGRKWSYTSTESRKSYNRSEGLAVASLEMFKNGVFSSDPNQPYQVDTKGLGRMSAETLAKGMQVSSANPMTGLEGRAGLLVKLSAALENQELFGTDGRPGKMIDYLFSHPTTQAQSVPVVLLPTLWSVLMDGLSPIWPATRTKIDGVPLGDAWPCSTLPANTPGQPWENIVPFHKLTQWLCYSLMVPMTKLLRVHFAGAELMTGLPEYRNGGLLVDTGLLTLKKGDMDRGLAAYHQHVQSNGQKSMEVIPMFEPSDDVIVEWRAVTVGFLDELLAAVNKGLGLQGSDALSLAQMLEAGTWKGGRELAAVSRPNTKEPPIAIISDGTVF